MGLTTAMQTGLSGLAANSSNLDVIGNNIANVNTPAYKSGRGVFATQFTNTLSYGSPPSATTGGTNPMQVGLGTKFAGIQRNFNGGAIQTTGISSNLALEGSGFFIVDMGESAQYTRAGAFLLNRDNQLVDVNGGFVQGFSVDQNFNIIPGQLTNLTVPLGSLTLAEATQNVYFRGNLNADGDTATTGSEHDSTTLYTDATLTTPATSATDLTTTNVYIDDGTGTGTLAFTAGSSPTITISGVEKGGKELASTSFAFSSTAVAGTDGYGATLGDFMTFLDQYYGLDSTMGGGVTMSGGVMTVAGNQGTVQDLDFGGVDFVSNDASGLTNPFEWARDTSGTNDGIADGESVRTTFVVYDSLGTPLMVDVSMVKSTATPNGGTTWDFMAESADSEGNERVIGTGQVEFDSAGNFVSTTTNYFSVVRGNGAVTPLNVTLRFADPDSEDELHSLRSEESRLAAGKQDGAPMGTLESYGIGDNGLISGSFTNGQTRALGQIAIASFANPEGLVENGNNLFSVGPNSGEPIVIAPTEFGTGRVISSALELSNVDLADEFVRMITSSTGFSAASRVITTADQMLQQLLMVGR